MLTALRRIIDAGLLSMTSICFSAAEEAGHSRFPGFGNRDGSERTFFFFSFVCNSISLRLVSGWIGMDGLLGRGVGQRTWFSVFLLRG
jgi:hypothetical protein